MTNKEAIKYLIAPIATNTNPSAEYLKQKEAYELAIRALEFAESQRICCDNCVNHTRKSKEVCTSPYGQCEFFEDKTQ